ncbi:hypothetical protein BD626DRAFT_515102 [Schizophyllum amplum]|uniref:Fork-head domain-containing protein n=1 Tax=Schizophyllum amplum TaxID=97359 RepID=A0A550BXW7_9AGAR|nr:hypothetical protein BD626DRAFT_515102 [Auriculariopsis ampla]
MHLEQPYGTPPYAVPIPPAELTTSSAEPPSLQYPLPIVDQHLQPPATPSDSSSSPEAYEEPQQDAAFTARDIENEAYIRTKLRVADGIPVGLNLVRSLGRDQRPEASIPTLIMLAIQGCKRSPKELTLHEIAQEFTTHLEFYRYTTTSWRASVRHALSLHKIFRQRSRKDIEGGGRGGFWHLDFSEGEGTKRLRKRLSRAQRAPKDEDTEQSTEDDMGSSFDEDDGEKSDKHAPYPSARAGPSSAARPGPSSSARAGPSPARTRRPAPQPSLDAISEPAMTGYRAPEAEAGDARFVEAGDPRFAPAGSSTSARGAHTQDRGAHIQGRGAQPRGRGRRTAGDESVQDTKGKGRA